MQQSQAVEAWLPTNQCGHCSCRSSLELLRLFDFAVDTTCQVAYWSLGTASSMPTARLGLVGLLFNDRGGGVLLTASDMSTGGDSFRVPFGSSRTSLKL